MPDEQKPGDKKPKKKLTHIKLTSHLDKDGVKPMPINWGAPSAEERGPVIASMSHPEQRNAIGAHSGSYAVYRALAIAAGQLDPIHVPDLTNTTPAETIGPYPQWGNPKNIVSFDPWGHMIAAKWGNLLKDGFDIRPTIAVTKAHMKMPEIDDAIAKGRLKPDGNILKETGEIVVTKAAIEPVWWLPGVAARFGVDEAELRRSLFEHTGGMFTELVTRADLEVFLPPIGGMSVYFFGDLHKLGDQKYEHACRIHDECNGSDVFGSDICTCRPYLAHGIEICVDSAQKGGVGVICYNRKEGRALGEVTKFLVYNARKRQEGGDRADKYFHRTECVAGVQDMRFQELMPDVIHWLGIKRIDRFASMSNMKHDALTGSGIEIGDRIAIPDSLIPADARVEMEAKMAAGYFTSGTVPDAEKLAKTKGRGLNE